jgi:hypothetical protein
MDFGMFPISFYLDIYSLHRLILYTTIDKKSNQNFVDFLKNHTKSRYTKKATAQKAVRRRFFYYEYSIRPTRAGWLL